jgi:hypothetical protein
VLPGLAHTKIQIQRKNQFVAGPRWSSGNHYGPSLTKHLGPVTSSAPGKWNTATIRSRTCAGLLAVTLSHQPLSGTPSTPWSGDRERKERCNTSVQTLRDLLDPLE